MSHHPEDFTTIKVDLTKDGAAILLHPRDDAGSEILQKILDAGPDTMRWNYMGMNATDDGARLIGANFACGGSPYWRTEGNSSSMDYADAIKIHLDLADVQDEEALVDIRKYAWLSGIAVDADSTNQKFRLLPAGACKICNGPMARTVELEWQVCDGCADNCAHDYIEGLGQIGGNLAYMPFCRSCGRGDPNWKPNADPMRDLLEAVAKSNIDGVIVHHSDGTSTSIMRQ